MPTLIDQLYMTLSLDPKDYETNSKRVIASKDKMKEGFANFFGDIEDGSKKSFMSLGKLATELGGLALGLLGAKSALDFAGALMKTDAAAGRLSLNINANTKDITAWGLAFKEFGGSAEDANAALSTFSELGIKAFKVQLSKDQSNALQLLGFHNYNDLLDPDTAMSTVAHAAMQPKFNTKTGKAYFNDMLQSLGLSPTIATMARDPQFHGSASVFDKFIEQQKKLSEGAEADAKAAIEFNKQLVHLEGTLQRITRGPLAEFIKDLDNLLGGNFANISDPSVGEFASGVSDIFGGNFWGGVKKLWGSAINPDAWRQGNKPSADGYSAPPNSRRASIADRNNNPGNIRPGAGGALLYGADGIEHTRNGAFLHFPSAEAGAAAQKQLLMKYWSKGLNTPYKIASHWAPWGDGNNNPISYAGSLAGALGTGIHSLIDPSKMGIVAAAMARREGYHGIRARAGNSHVTVHMNVHTKSNDPHKDAKVWAGALHDNLKKRNLVMKSHSGLN